MNATAACLATDEIVVTILCALGFLQIDLRPLRLISARVQKVVKIAVQSVPETEWLEVLKVQDSVRTSWFSIEGALRQAFTFLPNSARISHYYQYLARKDMVPNVSLERDSSFVKAVQKVFNDPEVADKVCSRMRAKGSINPIWMGSGWQLYPSNLDGLWTDYICHNLQHNDWEDFACASTLYPETIQEIQCMAIIAASVETSVAEL